MTSQQIAVVVETVPQAAPNETVVQSPSSLCCPTTVQKDGNAQQRQVV